MVALVTVGLAVATIRVIVAGDDELAASTAALDAGDPREAIVRARRAAGWYAPGAPHVAVAYARLQALAEGAEEHGHRELALLAWRSIRTAALETRWGTWSPHAVELGRANRSIARLEATEPRVAEPDPKVLTEAFQQLARPTGGGVWSFVLVGGWLCAAVGFALGARRAAAVAGTLDLRAARIPFGLVVVGLVLWLAAVWRA